ncbi:S8 family peptidase [Nocardioides sediminis]|uniref:S8 family peptidase n=1 Tax=Nocardioides sediminis TaxID=433648 RepID=UPI00190237DE|nr:S8 family serine peptidase [Nocardioides sediminis]
MSSRAIDMTGFAHDEEFVPVPLTPPGAARAPGPLGLGFGSAPPTSYVVRGRVDDEGDIDSLRSRPDVLGVWTDTPVAPFPQGQLGTAEPVDSPAAGACPIGTCDCGPGTPKGTIADVANYLGVSNIWSLGFRGAGIVVGVVDGGITAQGRPVKTGETSRRIPRVIGGWPTADWGTEASKWGEHGNMCSTDVLGMAPDAQIYDMRISGAPDIPATISRALQAFQWAINQHRIDGTPQVLSNSWGIFQESWDPTYARDPNHPFTRKVLEALDEGILVLFAAGNCGGTCPDGRCGPDNGPGRSIWGANSHRRVMTVGAVNRNEEFVGYSSQGPGALEPNKPDFCAVTHFTGYFTSDSGTSAATPILAGCVALLKQAFPAKTQDQIRSALATTAKDIGPAGFDQHSGAGIVRIKGAYDSLRGIVVRPTLACPSRVIACSSVACPSEVFRCQPSLSTPCASLTVVCRSLACPTSGVACQSLACPSTAISCSSRVCPTLACHVDPIEPGQFEEMWYDEGQGGPGDPTAGWYGG